MPAVTREFTFDASHLLPGHKGQCKNLHGHTYMLEVTVTDSVAVDGMVLDYGDLKQIVNSVIADYDHAFLVDAYSEDAFEKDLFKLCKKYNKKYKLIIGRTTTENIASTLIRDLPFQSCKLRLHETPNTFVEVVLNEGEILN